MGAFVFVFVFVYLCVLDVRHVQTSIYIYVEDPCQCGSVVRRRPVRQLPDGNHCLLSTLAVFSGTVLLFAIVLYEKISN